MPGRRQAFSTLEFEARLRRVREAMHARRIDVLLVTTPENIYYLTGYQTSGYFAYQALIVSDTAAPILFIRHLERGNVAEYSWLSDFVTWKEGDDVVARTLDLLGAAGAENRSVGLEKGSWFLTAVVAEALTAGLTASRIVDARLLVERVRLVKSAAELGYLRRAAGIAELQQRAAWSAISAGTPEADVAAAVFRAGIAAGCDYTGLPHHIMSGDRYEVGHATWSGKPIRQGELVLLELYGCVARYHATQMRTVSVGPPGETATRASDLIMAAQDAAFAAMRPGASARAVDALVRRPLRRLRPDYVNRTGYSIGIGFPPRTGEWDTADFNEQQDWELKENMVFHMLALAQGFGISETVLVTATGVERLTAANPRALVVR
ncbi:MAG: Xaa-Pro peptidase family protein [Dongiaceae bacterium]